MKEKGDNKTKGMKGKETEESGRGKRRRDREAGRQVNKKC